MYHSHPSDALNRAFAAHPYQGVEPERARFLFVGLDANYSPTIEQTPIFPKLLAYLKDGVGFWQTHNVHHPFLLPEYKGDGRKYHKTFSRIGFTAANAAQVSFVELVHVPTFGRSALVNEDLDRDHLERLNRAIEHGNARHVFIPDGVAKLMRASSLFPWMPRTPVDVGGPLKVWHKTDRRTVHWHYHLSAYGKFEQEKTKQLNAIRDLMGRTD
jgi:hypothetical protein